MTISGRSANKSATVKRDLHEGRSIWAHSAWAGVPTERLQKTITADVAIVGAGISGAFMADALSKRYTKVVVLDRREPVHGSTEASTALLQFEIDQPLTKLSDQIGTRKARAAWRRSWRTTRDLVELVHRERIPCGLAERDTLYLAGDEMNGRALAKECRARHAAGLPGLFLEADVLRSRFSIDREGAILSPGSAVANPVQLSAGLLRRAVKRGATIYSETVVKDIDANAKRVLLRAGEHVVEAQVCVFCTGYETLKGLPSKGTKVSSTWAIASQPHAPLPAWLKHTLIWEASDPYLYIRTEGNRLIVGGEDEEVASPRYRVRKLEKKAATLVRKAEALIPDLHIRPAYRWTGAFGESSDGLPFIGAVPGMPGCFAVIGFGGNGTIYSLMAAQIIPTLLKGPRDPDAALFRFPGSGLRYYNTVPQ
ncbi:MAG TPA: FAD-binding oxidoreductase [Rhizomicrobium sp.]|jgi:glycine/D-amino acid oxidase-like deaminating enzyme